MRGFLSRLPGVAAIVAALAAGAFAAALYSRSFAPRLFLFSAAASHRTAAFAETAANPSGLDVFDRPRPFPDVSFRDGKGEPTKLDAFRGRVVLLNIWASWCLPCREEMASLNRLDQKLGGQDFMVLPLSVDRGGVAAVEAFYRQFRLSALPVFVDRSMRAADRLEIPGIPTSFLLDREGREIARKIGPLLWDDPQILAFIRHTLQPAAGSVKEALR